MYKIIKVKKEDHHQLKVLAAMQGVTLSEMISRLVRLHEKIK